MNYYEVAPIARIPLSSPQSFTYMHPQKMEVGFLVEISIAGKKRKGIITKKTTRPRFPTKEIEKVLQEEMIDKNQLELAKKISDHYITSLGVVLRFFIMKISKKKKQPQSFGRAKKQKVITLTPKQKAAIQKLWKLQKNKAALLFGPASSGKTEVIFNLAEKTAKQGKQVLILIPELFLSNQEIERYSARLKKYGFAFFSSENTSSENRFIYENLKNKKLKIVLSTRMGLFLPFSDLGLIVIDEEQDPSFKQWDQMPNYHARQTAEMLASVHKNTKLFFCSATPCTETLYRAQKKQLELVKLPSLSTKEFSVKKPKIEIVHMAKYFRKGSPFSFSTEMKKELSDSLKKKEVALLLVPRRGKSSAVICSDCKQVQRCPKCETALIHSQDTYHCLHCSHKMSTFSRCSNCKSMKLVDFGFGTERVSSELKTLYPSSEILTIDANLIKNKKQRVQSFEKIQNNKVDFIVGTYAVAKGLDFPNVGFAGIINADNWAGKTDFRFDENWMGNLFQFAGRLNRPGSKQEGKLCIQTYLPEKNFSSLMKWNWEDFAKQELSQRKPLNYPPYRKMLKISYKDADLKQVEKKVKTFYNKLLKTPCGKDVFISEPYKGVLAKTRGKNTKHILIKYNKKLSLGTMKEIKKLPSPWSVNVDPEHIF